MQTQTVDLNLAWDSPPCYGPFTLPWIWLGENSSGMGDEQDRSPLHKLQRGIRAQFIADTATVILCGAANVRGLSLGCHNL